MNEKRQEYPKPKGWRPFARDKSGRRLVHSEWDYGDFELRVHTLIDDDYTIRFTYVEVSGDAITSGTLQDVQLGKLRRTIAKAFRHNPQLMDWEALIISHHDADNPFTVQAPEEQLERMREVEAEVKRISKDIKGHPPGMGRGVRSPDHYRRIAQMYLEMYELHGERGTVKAMVEELGENPNTVSGWIRRARSDDWLGPARDNNRAGGKAGERLNQWRKEHEEE